MISFLLVWTLLVLGTAIFAFWQVARALRSGVAGGRLGWKAVARAENPVVFWMMTSWLALMGCLGLGMLAFMLANVNWNLV